MSSTMQTIIREMRGIPFFLLREYLEELGGTAVSEDRVEASGWRVNLERMEPFRLGSLSVGQTRLVIEIEEHLVDEFLESCRLVLASFDRLGETWTRPAVAFGDALVAQSPGNLVSVVFADVGQHLVHET